MGRVKDFILSSLNSVTGYMHSIVNKRLLDKSYVVHIPKFKQMLQQAIAAKVAGSNRDSLKIR